MSKKYCSHATYSVQDVRTGCFKSRYSRAHVCSCKDRHQRLIYTLRMTLRELIHISQHVFISKKALKSDGVSHKVPRLSTNGNSASHSN